MIPKKILHVLLVLLLSFQIFMCIETAFAPPPTTYELILESTDGTDLWNLGSIVFDGTSYSLSQTIDVEPGTYTAEYVPESGYAFVRWEPVYDVSVDDEYANPGQITVSADGGVLVAIFEELTSYQVILESHDPLTLLWGEGTIIFDGTPYDPAVYDLYVEDGTYTAEYVPESGYAFLYWNGLYGVSVPDNFANPVEVTVSADGVLVAFYEEVEEHDVAAVDQTAAENEVLPGTVVDIDVTVTNLGQFTETFDLTCYYDSVELGTVLVVDLAPGETRVVTFTWDTTGVPMNTYLITAWADSGEAIVEVDESNNWCNMQLPIFVIPEVPLGTVITVLSMFIAFAGFIGFKRFRPKLRPQ